MAIIYKNFHNNKKNIEYTQIIKGVEELPTLFIPNISSSPILKDPNPSIQNIQYKLVKNLLGMIGVEYIPIKIFELLKHYDAFYAVDFFLKMLNMDYSLLCSDKKKRLFLNQALQQIRVADKKRLFIGLSDKPLYASVKKNNLEELTKKVQLLKRISELVSKLNTIESKFLFFDDFKTKFIAEMNNNYTETWDTINISKINKIIQILGKLDDLSTTCNNYIDNFEILGKIIKKNAVFLPFDNSLEMFFSCADNIFCEKKYLERIDEMVNIVTIMEILSL